MISFATFIIIIIIALIAFVMYRYWKPILSLLGLPVFMGTKPTPPLNAPVGLPPAKTTDNKPVALTIDANKEKDQPNKDDVDIDNISQLSIETIDEYENNNEDTQSAMGDSINLSFLDDGSDGKESIFLN